MNITHIRRAPKVTDKRISQPRRTHTRLGQSIWMYRFGKWLTQRELAARAGVSRKTIHAIEAGKTLPTLLVAMKIAAAFNIRVEELFKLK